MTDQNRPLPPEGDPNPAESGSRWWESPSPSAASTSDCLEFCPICRGAELLRAGGAPELRGQVDDLSREALLTLRTLIDHYLERTESASRGQGRVEEIPIE